MNPKCPLITPEGRCGKDKRYKCDDYPDTWIYDDLKAIEKYEVCPKCSDLGNYFYTITEDDIAALRDGKVLCDVGEYGIFVRLKKEEKQDEEHSIGGWRIC